MLSFVVIYCSNTIVLHSSFCMILYQIIDISKQIVYVKHMIPVEKLQFTSLAYGMMMKNRDVLQNYRIEIKIHF